MQIRTIMDTSNSSVTTTRNANALSTVQNVLAILGYQDQQAAIQIGNSLQRESGQELRESIKAYELKSNSKHHERLLKALQVEIERVKTEYRQAKSNHAKFQRQVQTQAKATLSQGYLTQLGHRIMTNIKINNPSLMFVIGFFILILGILMVIAHNIWEWNWKVLITNA